MITARAAVLVGGRAGEGVMGSILKLLGLRSTETFERAPAGERDTVRRIIAELDGLPPDRARYVATFAFLLSRVARADLRVGADETRAMERIVMEEAGLPEEQAMIVVQMAKTQNLLFGGTDNYSVAKEFARVASREEKLALLGCLFRVSAADGSISTLEDNVVRQMADELGLDHADFIEVRTRYRDHLAVLRKPDDDPAGGGA